MKTRRAGRAHSKPGRQPVERDVRNRMVLQGKPHLENGVVPWCRSLPKRRDQFNKRHGVGEAIHGCLVHRTQAIGERSVDVDLAAQRDDTGKVAHGFPRSLFAPIRHRGADKDVALAGPPKKRDLKCRQQSAEEGCSRDPTQFPRGVGQFKRDQ